MNEHGTLEQKLAKALKSESSLKEKLKELKSKNEESKKACEDLRKTESSLKTLTGKKEHSLVSELKKKDAEIENLK